MKNGKDFISRVVKKMGYNPDQFTVVDGNVYDEFDEDVSNALDYGMVFIEGSCVNDSIAYQIVREYNTSESYRVITADIDDGVSIIVSALSDTVEGINVQPLGVINAFLNQLIKGTIQEPTNTTAQNESEHISLKDYYRLNLPDNKIGRKSDKTLIRELEEAGFKV